MSGIKPTISKERFIVIDALRGFALFGILFANLYSFIGYNTYSPDEIIALPIIDKSILFFIDWFVEGKFYSTFSILFGVGFALQLERFHSKNTNFISFWYKRMIILCAFGLLHMFFIWNGDILTLYAVLGMFLPLFIKCSNKTLFIWILFLLLMPLVMYVIVYATQDSGFWGSMQRYSAGIKEELGFGNLTLLEMRTSDRPIEVYFINILSAIPRPMSYLLSGRYFHVLGLFLIGVLLARIWIPKIQENSIKVSKAAIWIGIIGLITSFAYGLTKWISGTGYALNELGIFQVIVYNIGSTSLALGIAFAFIYVWSTGRTKLVFKNLAFLGRMALTNYIFQNVIAIFLFFGYGFALMRKVPFAYLPFFAFGILLIQWIFSRFWLKNFKQGPLEYLWRKLSYKSQ